MKIIHKGGLLPLLYLGLAPAAVAQDAGEAVRLPEVSVSAPADTAFFAPDTASQGAVTGKQIEEQPRSRVGEVLEVVPGLIATQHSGEGKANQYFLRGFNLDHGTDMAIWVDDVPINMRTHAHGQGYSDLNWLMPETVNSVEVRKGPYFADEGDFASAGNLHIGLIDSVNKSVASLTVGSFGYERVFGMGSTKMGEGTLLFAGEAGAYNGPWANPDDMRKISTM